jgi:hypothetical protein
MPATSLAIAIAHSCAKILATSEMMLRIPSPAPRSSTEGHHRCHRRKPRTAHIEVYLHVQVVMDMSVKVLGEGFSCVQGSLHCANDDILPCHLMAPPRADWVVTLPDAQAHVAALHMHQRCV